VVHRDIKPSNILVQDSTRFADKHELYHIKIIDFAESYSPEVTFYEGEYACSHPYSPLECAFKKQESTDTKEGIVNKEIDYWSVGITLYELFFRKLPVSYSRPFLTDICLSWKNELILTVNQRQKYGLALVDDIITIICVKMMKLEQEKRMKLPIAKRIFELLEEYVKSLLDFLEQIR
jgi:serine/threonine protein kinase